MPTSQQPAKKAPAKKKPPAGTDLQTALNDASGTVVTEWVQSEKMTGNDKLDAALQQLTQAYRAWKGNNE
jgi:hypothetical protein